MKIFFKKNNQIFLIILLLVISSLPAISPLFHDGFFISDDGEWMIIRFSAFYQALHDGQFPVRFLHRLNFGYGYPVATFLYPGFMYLAVLLHILKFGLVGSIKIIFGISLVGSAVFVYLWLSKLFSKQASFFGALFSLYLPYHLYDVYKRGSVGEVLALLWIPFILWSVERKSAFFSSLGITLLILSHNTLALLFLPVILFYMFLKIIYSKDKKNQLHQYVGIITAGLGMSAFFIVPAVFELGFTQFLNTKVSTPFAYFVDLKLIGLSTILIVLFSAFTITAKYHDLKKYKYFALLFLIISLLSLFMSSSSGKFIWETSITSFVQFPYRFLSYLVIATGFLSAFVVSEVKGIERKIIIIIFIAALVFSTLPFVIVKEYFDKGEGYYSTNDATTTVQDEHMPIWVKEKPTNRFDKKAEIVKGEGEIENIFYDNKKISFGVDLEKDSTIRINTIYWPGWEIYVDGKSTLISYNNQRGLMEIVVSEGKHVIEARFGETKLRLASDAISVGSLVLLMLILFRSRVKKHYRHSGGVQNR